MKFKKNKKKRKELKKMKLTIHCPYDQTEDLKGGKKGKLTKNTKINKKLMKDTKKKQNSPFTACALSVRLN